MAQTILVILAHPDDESGFGATLARHAQAGDRIVLVNTTRGEVGDIAPVSNATHATLPAVRAQELRNAADALGIAEARFLGYRDSGMDGSDLNNDPRAYTQADDEDVISRLVQIVREVRPQIVVTFEPGGWYGHPDHKLASKHATAAFDKAGEPSCYPETGEAWSAEKLYYAAFLPSTFENMREAFKAAGIDTDEMPEMELDPTLAEQVTHKIPVGAFLAQKRAGMAAHVTQSQIFGRMLAIPLETFAPYAGEENFIQVRPKPPSGVISNHL